MKKLFLIITLALFLSGCNITISKEAQREGMKDKSVETEEANDGLQSGEKEPAKAEEPADEGKKEEETMDITVYFITSKDNENIIDCSKTYPVIRKIPKTKEVAKAALNQLFIGPTEEEKGQGLMNHIITEKTSHNLKRIFIKNNTAYLDWADPTKIEGMDVASTSCGSGLFLAPIEDTLKQFSNIKRVIHAFEGSPSDFYNWIQRGCIGENDEYCDPTPFK